MQVNVPDFCFHVIGYPKIENGRCTHANAILVDRERGWFMVNRHFLDSAYTHTVLLPQIGKEPLTLFRGLCEHKADIALMRVSDPSILPESTAPLFRHVTPNRERRMFLCGRKVDGNHVLRLRFLFYPATLRELVQRDCYKHSIMCSRSREINLAGLSGSPLLDVEGNVLGIFTASSELFTLFTPSFAIEEMIRKALRPTLGERMRKVYDLIFA